MQKMEIAAIERLGHRFMKLGLTPEDLEKIIAHFKAQGVQRAKIGAAILKALEAKRGMRL